MVCKEIEIQFALCVLCNTNEHVNTSQTGLINRKPWKPSIPYQEEIFLVSFFAQSKTDAFSVEPMGIFGAKQMFVHLPSTKMHVTGL